jgi:cellulose synthase/poly-beta-1,6-N-acetylglucosamine synthase-like glycosyltransferase
VLRTTQRAGVTGSRNFGAAHATGDVLVFCDGHVRAEPGWLEPLVTALEDPGVGAVAPVVSSLDGEGYPGYGFTWRSPKLGTAWLTRPAERPQPVPMLCGCFLAVRRDAFERLGGFDSGLTLWGMEDADLCLSLWRLGLECRVVPASRIRHKFRPTFPYGGVNWAVTLSNTLRVATVHLPASALARVLAHYAAHPQFTEAAERLADSDAFARRAWFDGEAEHDGAWFIDRFEIEALR